MRKILLAALIFLVIITLFFVITIYINNGMTFQKNNPSNDLQDTSATEEISTLESEPAFNPAGAPISITDETEEETLKIVAEQNIEVLYNTAEYELKVNLYEKSKKQTHLKFDYYLDGVSTSKEFDSNSIKELENIFENRKKVSPVGSGYRVKSVYLNPTNSKVYIIIEQGSSLNGTDTSIYSYNLNSKDIYNIYSANGTFTDLLFSKNSMNIAFSYYDNPSLENFEENTLLVVLDCKADEFIVKDSRDKDNNIIGARDTAYYYDYELISWDTNKIIKVKEKRWPKESQSSETIEPEERETLYHVMENRFIEEDPGEVDEQGESIQNPGTLEPTQTTNPPEPSDGSKDSETTNPSESAGNETTVEQSEQKGKEDANTTLKTFYKNLTDTDKYSEGMKLLSEDFVLELAILKQFGVSQLGKKDIDMEQTNLYKDILQTARLDRILRTQLNDNTCIIYYYQTFAFGSGDQSKMAMEAQLKKVEDGWRIFKIRDGDITKEPFNE